MNSKIRNNEQKKPSEFLLQGDGFYFNSKILSRGSSVGQSSRIYYRRAGEVPFQWEMQPGTPKNRPQEEALMPLSPPPQVQGLGLPKPFVDLPAQEERSKVWFWRKFKIMYNVWKVKDQTSARTGTVGNQNEQRFQPALDQSDGEFIGSFNNSSSSSSSSSSYFSISQALESTSNGKESVEGPFCCSPWNISLILDEGDSKVYYCRIHKTAFAVENDGSLVGSRMLCSVSSVDQSFRSYHRSSEGVPFNWELQPGTPKHPPENELIPPPSPPPAVQSLGLPLPKLDSDEEPVKITKGFKLSRIGWFQIISKRIQRTEKDGEISFRNDVNAAEYCYSDCDSVPRSSSSASSIVVVSKSNSFMKLSKLRRDFLSGKYFCVNPRNL